MTDEFSISLFTDSPLRMEGSIDYEGRTAEEVFSILGDPLIIPQWYLLAKQVKMHPVKPGEAQTFNVEFTFFGDVFEEVLHWDPPHRYVYLARGENFPIKDYVSEISVTETAPGKGTMVWRVYCNDIEGAHFQKILPVMLPAINKASLENLAPMIGGVQTRVTDHF